MFQVFGSNVADACIDEDRLVISHKRGMVKMYSLTWIINNCTILDAPLGKFVELAGEGAWLRAGCVGNPDFGVPITVKLTGTVKPALRVLGIATGPVFQD